MANRLTVDQVASQLRQAIKAVAGGGFVAGSVKLSAEFAVLDLISFPEQVDRLQRALQEIAAEHQTNPRCYNGPYSPYDSSGEPKCKGLRLLQFVWNSASFGGQRMYIKFCLDGNRLILLSLHVDYDPGKFSRMEREKKKS